MEHVDPLIAAPAEPAVEQAAPGAEQPAPTADQEQVADGLFTRQQAQLAQAVLGVSTGLGILHHLAAETFTRAQERQPAAPPRRKGEDEPRQD